jgi:hypothetical protein
MKTITQLSENQVFTFGANEAGFHGAGAAGFAFLGTSKNQWRTNPEFQRAYKAHTAQLCDRPYDPQDLQGKWAILGKTGLMIGKEGKSYGIITTEAPGKQGVVNNAYLQKEMEKLIKEAKKSPELTFLCTNFGLSRAHGGFSWWNPTELKTLWEKAIANTGGKLPGNIQEPDWAKDKTKETNKDPKNPDHNMT